MSPLSKLIAEGPSYPPVTDEELEEIKNSPMSAEARALIDYFDSRARYIENWVARIVAEAAEKKALASNGDAPTVTADNKHADCDAPKPASSWLKRILKNENSQDKGKA
ncbi:MAG: hypothetical protein LBF16_03445 [Pseudomonadales bacterium]|jgi:hypothetical protein|nr:hypothetical protein [Pseudomonadales bacterium]